MVSGNPRTAYEQKEMALGEWGGKGGERGEGLRREGGRRMGAEGGVDGRGGKEGVREDIVVSENPRTAYEQKEMALGETGRG